MQLNHFTVRLRIIFAALLLAAVPLSARADGSALAPLVNRQTPAVVRVSCQKADLTALVRVAVKVGRKAIDASVKDPKMAEKAKASLPLIVAGYTSGLASLCDSYKKAGLDEIYFVVTPGSGTTLGFFAVPLGSIPKEKVEGLKKALLSLRTLNLPMPFCFELNGYLFAPVVTGTAAEGDGEGQEVQKQIREQFSRLRSDPRPDIQEAFDEFPDAAVSLVVTGNEKSSQRLAESIDEIQKNSDPRGAGASDDVSGKMLRLGKSARYGAMVFDQSDTSIKLRIRFDPGFDPAPTIEQIRGKLLSEITEDQPYAELNRSLVDALMPVSSPERLDWKVDEAYIQEHLPVFKDAVSFFLKKGGAEPRESVPAETNSDTK